MPKVYRVEYYLAGRLEQQNVFPTRSPVLTRELRSE